MKKIVTASIVLYLNDLIDLEKAIGCVLNTHQNIILYLIDNSPTDELKILSRNAQIAYLHNPNNPGFGAAHNIAISRAIEAGSMYHFIVNPDVYFDGDVVSSMVSYMKLDPKIGMMMPKILNLDGTVQNLPKLLPSPFSILLRKIKKPKRYYEKFIDRYELRFVDEFKIYNVPVLSGCFTVLNIKALLEIGMYDDKFFMYFEDWDLSRRMHQKYKTIYFPEVAIYHGYESGANKSSRLFKIFVNSAITYFNKWGWFFDSERKKINIEALSQFK